MLKDLLSVAQIKNSHWELRSVIGLSVYSTKIMDQTKEYSKYKKLCKVLLNEKRAKILNSNGWSFLILGWEANAINTSKEMKKEFGHYLQSIKELTGEHGIKIS